MSFLNKALSRMNDADKAKLGKGGGTHINTNGSHKVTIKTAYENEYEGTPKFTVVFEDAQGKTAEWSGSLMKKIGKNSDTGEPNAGMHSVGGVQTQLNKEDDLCDNLKVIGEIKNLWTICGLDPEKFGEGTIDGQVEHYGKTITAPVWNGLIGQSLTIVTSFELAADKKDPNKVWKNQKVSISNLFNSDGLSQHELDEGITEGKALGGAVKLAKAPAEQWSDIGYGIKFGSENNKACKQELRLLGAKGKAPVAETQTKEDWEDEL